MGIIYSIKSNDSLQLIKAIQTAKDFAEKKIDKNTVGIAFLGAIARGYYDALADIDIAFFQNNSSGSKHQTEYHKVDGFEIHCHVSDYESEAEEAWEMSKRWAFSHNQIYYDPQFKILRLLQKKLPLRPDERKWLLISGITLSEWYINRLTHLWIERGSVVSAHYMFTEGLNHFFSMLFAFNNELVADHKWRYYCAERLERLPPSFTEELNEVMFLHSMDTDEIKRRQKAFMEMWKYMLPLVEQEVKMSFDDFKNLV